MFNFLQGLESHFPASTTSVLNIKTNGSAPVKRKEHLTSLLMRAKAEGTNIILRNSKGCHHQNLK